MTMATVIFRSRSLVVTCMMMALSGTVGMALAQDEVDLSDNAVCLECHAGNQWSPRENTDRPRVHEDSGEFVQEGHDMWSCTDCHTDIVEIPHREGIERDVQCTNCHESTPE